MYRDEPKQSWSVEYIPGSFKTFNSAAEAKAYAEHMDAVDPRFGKHTVYEEYESC